MSLRIAPLTAFPEVPWRNGGGMTRLIASLDTPAFPAGFAWRVSLATIAQDGPFSRFTATRRLLGLASPGRLTLQIATEPPVLLDQPGAVTAFYGGDETVATCGDTPLRVFNLMLAPGSMGSAMRAERADFMLAADRTCFILPLAGAWRLATGGDDLGPEQIGFWRPAGVPDRLVAQNETALCLVASIEERGP